jgi:hypothetical protein
VRVAAANHFSASTARSLQVNLSHATSQKRSIPHNKIESKLRNRQAKQGREQLKCSQRDGQLKIKAVLTGHTNLKKLKKKTKHNWI